MLVSNGNGSQVTPDDSLNIVSLEELPGQTAPDLAAAISKAMVDPGYIVIRGLPYQSGNAADASAFLLDLANQLGSPISHDENGSLIWDIRAKENLTHSVPTFSEHADEAFLHTDSQYRDQPENLFALLCLRPATCGGGLSLLMTYSDLMAELLAQSDGADHKAALEEVEFPFAVPTAFKTDPEGPDEFVYSPILEGEQHLRFRLDTLESGLRTLDKPLPDRGVRALEAMKSVLNTSDRIKRFHLQAGDLAFFNNRSTLHGRTAFADKHRHLLRVRLKTDA